MHTARDAHREAQALLGKGFFARVLEPSPPAVDDGEWFADDPVNTVAAPGTTVVSPVAGAGLTWDAWLAGHPEAVAWAADRWLGAWRRLPPAPAGLADTRLALHRLAAYVLSPARRRVNTKIGLRSTLGGFGTPFFGEDEQVRLAGTTLVRQRGGSVRTAPVTTLAEAAAFILDGAPDVAWAAEFDVPPPGDPDAPLGLDPEAVAFLADWFGFAWSVLEELRAEPASTVPGRVQLWPEHFDAAFDGLDDPQRAGFGASPGDAGVGEPYLYVVPWSALPPSDVWNAKTFPGAVLPWSEFVDADDQRAAALAFYRRCRQTLTG